MALQNRRFLGCQHPRFCRENCNNDDINKCIKSGYTGIVVIRGLGSHTHDFRICFAIWTIGWTLKNGWLTSEFSLKCDPCVRSNIAAGYGCIYHNYIPPSWWSCLYRSILICFWINPNWGCSISWYPVFFLVSLVASLFPLNSRGWHPLPKKESKIVQTHPK